MVANLYLAPRKEKITRPFLNAFVCANSLKIFAQQILEWYATHKRDLPWRASSDPYKIWLSEIILQQTRVAQGLPYYYSFIEAFPTVHDLASAPEDQVLRLWQGLGYYSRARNLHACAQQVVSEYGGEFPDTAKALKSLKGIGPYTSSAIASMAFNEPVPVVDGNVYRLLSRLFDDPTDISSSAAYRHFYNKALELIPSRQPGNFNQAMMEFGATHCTPKNPDCQSCIFSASCKAWANGTVKDRPVKLKKVKVTNRFLNYFLFEFQDRVLINQRSGKDIWQGLYDFHCIEGDLSQEDLLSRLSEEIGTDLVKACVLESQSASIKHILTHQKLNAKFFRISLMNKDAYSGIANKLNLLDSSQEELKGLAKPILIENYLKSGALSLF